MCWRLVLLLQVDFKLQSHLTSDSSYVLSSWWWKHSTSSRPAPRGTRGTPCPRVWSRASWRCLEASSSAPVWTRSFTFSYILVYLAYFKDSILIIPLLFVLLVFATICELVSSTFLTTNIHYLLQVTVDVAKYTIGRLRPHFLDACRPLSDPCPSSVSGHSYVTDYKCAGDPAVIEEARSVSALRVNVEVNTFF